jgi:hypothetical protein
MQKIRLLHGRIHAGRVAAHGPIGPELALSISTDLVEVLSAAILILDLTVACARHSPTLE